MKQYSLFVISGGKQFEHTVIAEKYDVYNNTYYFYNLVKNADGTRETEDVARYPVDKTIIYRIAPFNGNR